MNEKTRRSGNIHRTYADDLRRFYTFAIPEGKRVLEIGCRDGWLIQELKPSQGLGIDVSEEEIERARSENSNEGIIFAVGDAETYEWGNEKPFDYVVLSDVVPLIGDVQNALENIRKVTQPSTRIILNFHNNLWQPLLKLANFLKLRRRNRMENWLSMSDLKNILYLAGYQTITDGTRVMFPFDVPFLTPFFNRFLAKLPILRHLCLSCFIMARPEPERVEGDLPTVSVLIPTRNEKGNVDDIFSRTPKMGKWTELIFVDGNSDDGTVEAIEESIEKHGDEWHRCVLYHQTGKGKGQAVRQGFAECRGDILMILDSDLTMPPEDLPKYYEAIISGRGEFINGCRLVYPMESKAMRFLNMIANKLFAEMFTWLLSQTVKDTLCGTKVLWRSDYELIAENRSYFGDFDPFGDFDLLFGASKLNLKIIDLPIRYRDRTYGDIKISRWTHGMLLFRMCGIAFKKLKLN